MPFYHVYPLIRLRDSRCSVKKSMHNTTNSTMFMENVQRALINEKNFDRCATNDQTTDCDRIKDGIQYTLRKMENSFKQDINQQDYFQKQNDYENFEVSLASGPNRMTYYSSTNCLESCEDGSCQKIYFTR